MATAPDAAGASGPRVDAVRTRHIHDSLRQAAHRLGVKARELRAGQYERPAARQAGFPSERAVRAAFDSWRRAHRRLSDGVRASRDKSAES